MKPAWSFFSLSLFFLLNFLNLLSDLTGLDAKLSSSMFIFVAIPLDWERKWQPTPVFLLRKSQGQREPGSLQYSSAQFSRSVVSDSLRPHERTAHQASLSIANSQSSPKLMSIESVMPCNHLILCRPLLLPPSIFPSIRVFSNESPLHIRWPKYWSFSFSISPSMNTQDWSPSGWSGWISSQPKGLSGVFSNTTVQRHQFFGTQLSL